MSELNEPTQIWQAVLTELAYQLPQSTFDNWLGDSQLLSAGGGVWRIGVSSPQAQAWLSQRLASTVQRVLDHNLTEHRLAPADLEYVVLDGQVAPLPSAQPAEQRAPPHPTEVIYQFVDFDLYERGWLKVPTYYELFWQPVLGYAGYAFWRYQQLVNWTNGGNFTRRRVIDMSRAAAHIGIDRKVLKGPKGGQIGGALAVLQAEGVGQFEVRGQGRHTAYSGQVLRDLPLLSPRQAETLPAELQDEHARWLLEAGFDLDRWAAFPAASLTDMDEQDALHFSRPDWEQLSSRGYLATPAYYDLFLQSLISPVGYGLWRLLKCLYYAPHARFTRERRITVDAIAQRLACHRQTITGCNRKRDGRRYWQSGAFDYLREERIAAIREEGQGRQRSYRIRVLNSPPLLTPTQVQRLPPILRDAHDEWIERARLDLEAWQQLDLPFLDDCEADADVQ